MSTVILKEHSSSKYSPRTYHNAVSSNFTIAFAYDMSTAGEILTKKAAAQSYIGFVISKEKIQDPLFITKTAQDIIDKIVQSGYKDRVKLNFAGNGIYTLSKNNISQKDINLFVYKIIEQINKEVNLVEVLSGGQTGVDFAAAVACQILSKKATITFPKGFLQRFENERDISQTKEQVQTYLDKNTQEIEQLLKNDKTQLTTSKIKP